MGLKGPTGTFFQHSLGGKKSLIVSVYPSKLKFKKEEKSRPTEWLFLGLPGGQKTIFYLRVACRVHYLTTILALYIGPLTGEGCSYVTCLF